MIAFHLVPRAYWEAQDPAQDYAPALFAREGFIHLTDDPAEMAAVASRYYHDEPGPHVYLYIDKARVRAPLRYDDPEHKYPHLYGPLNREAIVAVRPADRAPNGDFLPPPRLSTHS